METHYKILCICSICFALIFYFGATTELCQSYPVEVAGKVQTVDYCQPLYTVISRMATIQPANSQVNEQAALGWWVKPKSLSAIRYIFD